MPPLPHSEEDSPEALERRSLIIEKAIRILREASGEMFQKMLFDRLSLRDYPWEESSPILRGDPQFIFIGMNVRLRTQLEEEA